jgi:hypothetical protein
MTEKPLPFAYQFAAGAIAGVSEVPPPYSLIVPKSTPLPNHANPTRSS